MDNGGPSRIDLPRYLAALPLFDSADSDELKRLAQGSSLRGYDRGQALFHVGERCEGFHLAVMGHVKLFVLSACGQEKVIDIAGPGRSNHSSGQTHSPPMPGRIRQPSRGWMQSSRAIGLRLER